MKINNPPASPSNKASPPTPPPKCSNTKENRFTLSNWPVKVTQILKGYNLLQKLSLTNNKLVHNHKHYVSG